jgi:acetyl esterase
VSLDPRAQAVLARRAESGVPPYYSLPVLKAREVYRRLSKLAGPPEPVAKIEHYSLPTSDNRISLRAYTPDNPPHHPLPCVMFFHGGGFVMGDLEMYDALCRTLANRAQAIVAAVEYRLAPEYPFPTAPEDCYAATAWVAAHATELGTDGTHIAVMGDSAGATLATVVAMMARDRHGPALIQQVLIYPMLDSTLSSASMREFAELGPLVLNDFVWFYRHYLPSQPESTDSYPYASPLQAPLLNDLPATFIVTGECDPLRDEGDAYAHRLQAAGVPVSLKRYTGMIHGFFMMPTVLAEGREVMEEAATTLRHAFNT